MSLVNFAVDFDNYLLLTSRRVNADRGAAQPVVWKDYTQVDVYPVRLKPTGGLRDPLEPIDVTDRTLQIFIGTPGGTLYASLIDFTLDEVNDKFSGVISMNSAALTAAFTVGVTSIQTYIQFRLLGDGEPRSVIKPIRIERPIWEGAAPPDAEDQTPEWLVENLALIFDDSETVDVEQDGNSFKWHVRRKALGRVGADADGIFVEELVPAPDDFIDVLRLESPFAVGSIVNAASATDEVEVVAGGTAGVIYTTPLRIRGRYEFRSYAGGSAKGRFYTAAVAPGAPRNVWQLEISSPPQIYQLNYDVSNDGVGIVDFLTPPLLIEGGATITLSYDTKDGQQLSVDGMPVGVDEPEGVAVPFAQIDQADVIPATDLSGDETVYDSIDITAAGSTDVVIPKPHRIKSLIINVGLEPYPEAYEHNIVWKLEDDLHDGDLGLATLVMPASVLPTINFRNNSVGGTILFDWTNDSAVARTIKIEFVYTGTAWRYTGHYEVGASASGDMPLYAANDTGAAEPSAVGDGSIANGDGAIATGAHSSVYGGEDCEAVAARSVVLGGHGAKAHITGEVVLAGYIDTKPIHLFLSAFSSGYVGIPVRLASIGGGTIKLEADSVLTFSGLLHAWCKATDETATYLVEGQIKRVGATTSIVWENVDPKHEDEPAWDATVTADDIDESLYIGGIGEVGKDIDWAMELVGVYTKTA